LALRQGLRHVWCPRLASIARLGQIWVRSSLEPGPQRLVETRARLVVFESRVEVSVTRGPVRSLNKARRRVERVRAAEQAGRGQRDRGAVRRPARPIASRRLDETLEALPTKART